MEFQRERVYTALNADELKAGDKVLTSNNIASLKEAVRLDIKPSVIVSIWGEMYDKRFQCKSSDTIYDAELVYLIERKENCTNCGEGKWDAEHPELTKCCNYKRYECSEYKPKTEQKAEKDCDNCGQRCDGYGKGEVCSQWKSKAEEKNCYNCRLTYTRNGVMRCMMNDQRCYNPEVACYHYEPTTFEKHTDYNHCEEAKKAYACAMTNVCPNKHFRPFRDTDELIKVWWKKKYDGVPETDLELPLIWVKKHDDTDRGKLIISFSNNGCSVIDVDEIEVLLWEDLFNIYTFLDGSPCGVEE